MNKLLINIKRVTLIMTEKTKAKWRFTGVWTKCFRYENSTKCHSLVRHASASGEQLCSSHAVFRYVASASSDKIIGHTRTDKPVSTTLFAKSGNLYKTSAHSRGKLPRWWAGTADQCVIRNVKLVSIGGCKSGFDWQIVLAVCNHSLADFIYFNLSTL